MSARYGILYEPTALDPNARIVAYCPRVEDALTLAERAMFGRRSIRERYSVQDIDDPERGRLSWDDVAVPA